MNTIKHHNKSTLDLYAKFTGKYKDDFRSSGHSPLTWKMRKSLIDFMSRSLNYTEVDILDIGCNNGTMGRELCNALNIRSIKTNIDGIDFVEEATRIAKEVFNYRSTFVADIADEQLIHGILGTTRYQIVFCSEVFLYINPDDYKSFFTTIHSLLSDQGSFLFLVPNVRSVYHLLNKAIAPERFAYYFKYDYDSALINSLLGKYGFAVTGAYGAELFTKLKIDLSRYGKFKDLLSFEIAVLAKKT